LRHGEFDSSAPLQHKWQAGLLRSRYDRESFFKAKANQVLIVFFSRGKESHVSDFNLEGEYLPKERCSGKQHNEAVTDRGNTRIAFSQIDIF
jgi:hypothetical protein